MALGLTKFVEVFAGSVQLVLEEIAQGYDPKWKAVRADVEGAP